MKLMFFRISHATIQSVWFQLKSSCKTGPHELYDMDRINTGKVIWRDVPRTRSYCPTNKSGSKSLPIFWKGHGKHGNKHLFKITPVSEARFFQPLSCPNGFTSLAWTITWSLVSHLLEVGTNIIMWQHVRKNILECDKCGNDGNYKTNKYCTLYMYIDIHICINIYIYTYQYFFQFLLGSIKTNQKHTPLFSAGSHP